MTNPISMNTSMTPPPGIQSPQFWDSFTWPSLSNPLSGRTDLIKNLREPAMLLGVAAAVVGAVASFFAEALIMGGGLIIAGLATLFASYYVETLSKGYDLRAYDLNALQEGKTAAERTAEQFRQQIGTLQTEKEQLIRTDQTHQTRIQELTVINSGLTTNNTALVGQNNSLISNQQTLNDSIQAARNLNADLQQQIGTRDQRIVVLNAEKEAIREATGASFHPLIEERDQLLQQNISLNNELGKYRASSTRMQELQNHEEKLANLKKQVEQETINLAQVQDQHTALLGANQILVDSHKATATQRQTELSKIQGELNQANRDLERVKKEREEFDKGRSAVDAVTGSGSPIYTPLSGISGTTSSVGGTPLSNSNIGGSQSN